MPVGTEAIEASACSPSAMACLSGPSAGQGMPVATVNDGDDDESGLVELGTNCTVVLGPPTTTVQELSNVMPTGTSATDAVVAPPWRIPSRIVAACAVSGSVRSSSEKTHPSMATSPAPSAPSASIAPRRRDPRRPAAVERREHKLHLGRLYVHVEQVAGDVDARSRPQARLRNRIQVELHPHRAQRVHATAPRRLEGRSRIIRTGFAARERPRGDAIDRTGRVTYGVVSVMPKPGMHVGKPITWDGGFTASGTGASDSY